MVKCYQFSTFFFLKKREYKLTILFICHLCWCGLMFCSMLAETFNLVNYCLFVICVGCNIKHVV